MNDEDRITATYKNQKRTNRSRLLLSGLFGGDSLRCQLCSTWGYRSCNPVFGTHSDSTVCHIVNL